MRAKWEYRWKEMNWSEREEDMVVAGYRHIGVQTVDDSFLTHACALRCLRALLSLAEDNVIAAGKEAFRAISYFHEVRPTSSSHSPPRFQRRTGPMDTIET
jgi:hypothetical protein